MDWLYALGGVFAIVGVAILLGWTEKHGKSPAIKACIWIGSILLLLGLGLGSAKMWEFCLLLLIVALRSLGNIPSWVFYAVGGGIACFACWYVFNLMGQSIIELGQELRETRERIALMERSIEDKLRDIANRLPEQNEPFL